MVAGDVDVTTLKAQINDAFSAWQNPEPADQVQGSQTQDSQAQDRVLMIPSDNIRILQATDLVGSLLRLEGFHPSGAIRNEQDLRRREMMGAIFLCSAAAPESS